MSTFLELCQDLHREVGGAGSAPSAVTGQVGQSLRTVNWIKNAWIKIQNKHANWRWMRKHYYIALADSTSAIASSDLLFEVDSTFGSSSAAPGRFGRWWTEYGDVRLSTGSLSGATYTNLIWLDYWDFADRYRRAPISDSTPAHFSVDDGNRLVLGPATSGSSFFLVGDYQRSPQVLAVDSDEPEMPERFHELIVWEAMRRYARFVAAPEVWADAKNEAASLMRALEVDQLPPPKFAPPLA